MMKKIRIILIIVFALLSILGICRLKPLETGLLQGFLNSEHEELLQLSDKSSSTIGVLIESDDIDRIEEIKNNLPNSENFDELIELYKSHPENFITHRRRSLLKNKKYNELAQESLEQLYNPLGIFIQTPDKDPYLFVTDYIMNLRNPYFDNEIKEFDGKYYTKISLPASEIKTLTNLQKKNPIYLTGTPVHTFVTSQKSAFEINIICIISMFALILLCKKYFNSVKILIPIALSIIFGFGTGFFTALAIFGKLHILTIVFATSLIGISLDYSLHYVINKDIIKNLTVSMITTVTAFLLLTLSGIELLKQIGVFTSFGLIGVYLFVVFFLPLFKLSPKHKTLTYPNIPKKIVFASIIILSVIGLFKIQISDDIKTLYSPPKTLLNAEILSRKVFPAPQVSFITVKGNNIEEILQKEEAITDNLNSDFFSMSRLIPSQKRQEENIKLVNELYTNNLSSYADFPIQKKSLAPVSFDLQDKFMLDDKTSFIIVFDKDAGDINLTRDISEIMKNLRLRCVKIIPIIFIMYFILLSAFFRPKKALKIIASPLIASIFAISAISVLGIPINMFHILSIFLILGFSLDYSIFMSDQSSKDAVFISFASSFLSFLLLSFTSFKLISSMGLMLSIGLMSSYILSLTLFRDKI